MDLNENELNSLRGIADLKTGRSSVLAQNILCFGYGECSGGEAQMRIKRKYKFYN